MKLEVRIRLSSASACLCQYVLERGSCNWAQSAGAGSQPFVSHQRAASTSQSLSYCLPPSPARALLIVLWAGEQSSITQGMYTCTAVCECVCVYCHNNWYGNISWCCGGNLEQDSVQYCENTHFYTVKRPNCEHGGGGSHDIHCNQSPGGDNDHLFLFLGADMVSISIVSIQHFDFYIFSFVLCHYLSSFTQWVEKHLLSRSMWAWMWSVCDPCLSLLLYRRINERMCTVWFNFRIIFNTQAKPTC